MKLILSIVTFLGFTIFINAQITGTVTNEKGDPLPFVNIYVENTYKGTTTNDDGYFELSLPPNQNYTLVFAYLGYTTHKETISLEAELYELNISLKETTVSLDEVVVNAEENPANIIIRKAIERRKFHLNQIKAYTADFYSKGLIKIENVPEKILGQEVGDLEGVLDSTRSGVLYLSETISKIEFIQPNQLKEEITASKVSGNDNGFSFNSALDVDYNFYQNTISLGNEIISPIANNAFNYYNYKLEGVFYDEYGHLINKIKLTPKRANEPAFNGEIYIVEDQWAIYALDLSITGIRAKIPAANTLQLQQSFNYNPNSTIWARISQSIDFSYGLLGFNGTGRFTAVYSNYEFNDDSGITRADFGNELVVVQKEANKKDSLFWNTIRPVPLTIEEQTDYVKKDSLQTLRESKPYKDSLDRVNNRFKLGDILGYTYQNSDKNYRLGYGFPFSEVQFNTVQGFTAAANAFFVKDYDEFRRYLRISGSAQYGFSDERLRATGQITYKFNNISKPILRLSGGVEAVQFNPSNPISPIGNSAASLYFEENYMKLYDKSFIQLNYSEEWFNGFRFSGTVAYERRSALSNTTDQAWYPKADKTYTSNNPLNPFDETAPFENHHIIKTNIAAVINFNQKYYSYPGSKFNISSDAYPTLILGLESGFAATNSDYNFNQVKARLYQSFNVANKGRLAYNLRGGHFFNAENIAFMDFQHFNGNQINVSRRGNYTDVFNNLGYYDLSTNSSYFEAHVEHDFNGYILNKIPLINKLNFNLVIGAHQLITADISPYREFTIGLDNIGWGKWRFLRIDYIRSYQNGYVGDAFVFGLKFF